MLEIKARLRMPRSAYKVDIKGQLRLPFQSRQQGGLRAKLISGEEVGLMLPRGEILRGGDLVTASDGRVIEIISQDEELLQIEAAAPQVLARVAYHLGTRHVPVQVGADFLRIAADRELEEMVGKLGATVKHLEAPFEPETGAHAGGRRHGETEHAGATDDPRHDRGHVHDEHCGHDRLHPPHRHRDG